MGKGGSGYEKGRRLQCRKTRRRMAAHLVRPRRGRGRDRLDLPHFRPRARARAGARLDDLMQDDGPSFIAMITLVAVVVATVILVFFGIGYLLGKIFL